jgi:hypothetical protein
LDSLLCPLCGRRVSLRIFNPSRFEDDILAVTVTGLGRGRGFAEINRYSVLGDPDITVPIANRCKKILKMVAADRLASDSKDSLLEQWISYASGLEFRFAELERQSASNAALLNSYIQSYNALLAAEYTQRIRAEKAEHEYTSLRRRIQNLEYLVRGSTNSNLPLEEGIGLLLEN